MEACGPDSSFVQAQQQGLTVIAFDAERQQSVMRDALPARERKRQDEYTCKVCDWYQPNNFRMLAHSPPGYVFDLK